MRPLNLSEGTPVSLPLLLDEGEPTMLLTDAIFASNCCCVAGAGEESRSSFRTAPRGDVPGDDFCEVEVLVDAAGGGDNTDGVTTTLG